MARPPARGIWSKNSCYNHSNSIRTPDGIWTGPLRKHCFADINARPVLVLHECVGSRSLCLPRIYTEILWCRFEPSGGGTGMGGGVEIERGGCVIIMI